MTIFQSCFRYQNVTFWVCKSVLGTQRMYSQHQNVILRSSGWIIVSFLQYPHTQYCTSKRVKNNEFLQHASLTPRSTISYEVSRNALWCWEYILWVPKTLLHTQNAKFWRLEQLWKIVKNDHHDFYCILPSRNLKKG